MGHDIGYKDNNYGIKQNALSLHWLYSNMFGNIYIFIVHNMCILRAENTLFFFENLVQQL